MVHEHNEYITAYSPGHVPTSGNMSSIAISEELPPEGNCTRYRWQFCYETRPMS